MSRFVSAFLVLALLFSPAVTQEKELKGWGNIIDPDGDCVIKHDKDRLTLTIPGTPHDINTRTGKVNAPRVLQEVEGDFTAMVEVRCDLKPGMNSSLKTSFAFNGAGLLIWQDDKNFIRLERNTWMTPKGELICFPPLLEYFQEGKYMETNPKPVVEPFFKDSTHFRVERKGNKLRALLSHDGRDWSLVREMDIELDRKLQVGIAAVNTSRNPLTVTFENFRLSNQ